VIFEKKINFAEYREYLYPLSYLLEESIIDGIKEAASFEKRIAILSTYFSTLLNKYEGSLQPATIVSKILDQCFQKNDFTRSIEDLAAQFEISPRTLQRYFETCTGISSKQALQVMRIRKATAHLVNSPGDFNFSTYGYYDYSHFYKHLKQFLETSTLVNMKPHLELLQLLHK
jgi:AraC-like DNA-binding protein